MTLPRRRPSLTDDAGASLVFALVIVTVVAVVAGGLLSLADANLRTTVAVRAQAGTAATADGAAQAAINALRTSPYNNDTSSSTYPRCFGTTDTLVLPDLVPGATGSPANSAAVRCSPDPTTGAAGGLVPITAANKPGNAILTLGQVPGEDGINVKALSSSIPFNVHGGIVSDSNINVTNGTLQSNTTITAATGCSGTIVSNPSPANCSAGTAPDPNYAAEITSAPDYRSVPTSCPTSVVTFSPGYYDDAKALSDLMTTNSCKNTVWWFQPGAYYFDFQNTAKSAGSANAHQWRVDVGQLVAGTPTNSAGTPLTPAQLSAAAKPLTVPGACANPIESTTAVGVQFVFGGDSQLQVGGTADAEICGTYHTNRPPIAVYGLKSGTATPTTTTTSATSATATVTGPSTGFTAVPAGPTLTAGLTAAGDGKVDAFAPGTTSGTATLKLSGLIGAGGVPAGSNLTSATLRVVYGTSTTATSRTLTVTPVSSSGAGTTVTPSPALGTAAQTAGTVRSTDLTSALLTTVHDKGLTDLKVDYTTGLAAGGSEQLDAVLLDLTYTAPALRGETTAAVPGNCLAKTYTGGSGGQCAVLSTDSAYKGRFYVQGTTYTPAAPIDITLSNITEQVLRFGVVSRTLWVKETGSVSYVGPVIEIPNDSPGYGPGGTVVHLTVYVCPGVSTCSTSTGRESLRARVYLFDPSGSPSPPSRQMTIQSWAVLR